MSGSAADWDAWGSQPDSTTPLSPAPSTNPILARMAINQSNDASASGAVAPNAIQTGADASSGQAPAGQPAIDPAVLARLKAAALLSQQQQAVQTTPEGPVPGAPGVPPAASSPPPATTLPAIPPQAAQPPSGLSNGPQTPVNGDPVAAPGAAPTPSPLAHPAVQAQLAANTPPPSAPASGSIMTQPYSGQNIYSLITGGESGGKNVKNPNSTAAGPAQFLDGTWKVYASATGAPDSDRYTPEGAAKATQWLADNNAKVLQQATGHSPTVGAVVASHLLGAGGVLSLVQHPNDPISSVLPPDVISKNSGVLKPDMTGQEALTAIPSYYASHGGAGAGASASGSASPGGQNGTGQTYVVDPEMAQAVKDALGRSQQWSKDNPMGVPVSTQLLALAGGLLSGHSFTDALGKGFSALSGAQQKGSENVLKNNMDAGQLAKIGITGAAQQANILNAIARTGIQQQNADTNAARAAAMAKIGDRRLGIQEATADYKNGPQPAYVKQNAADLEGLVDNQQHIQQSVLPTIDNILADVDKAGTGPGVLKAAQRGIASALNLPVGSYDPDSGALTTQGMAQLRAGNLAIKGVSIRNQREFESALEGVVNAGQNPDVVKTQLGRLRSLAANEAQMGQDAQDMRSDPDAFDKMMRSPVGVQATIIQPRIASWTSQAGTAANPNAAPQGQMAAPNASAPSQAAAPSGGPMVTLRGPPTPKNPSGIFSVPEGPLADQYRAHGYK